MKKHGRILCAVLAVLLGITLCSCNKTKPAAEEIDEYLKKAQENPSYFTGALKLNLEYQKVVNELLSEYEYVITGEEDMEPDGNVKRKVVNVDFKGYDIGTYFQMYLDTLREGITEKMLQQYTIEELKEMSLNDPEAYAALYAQADLEHFQDVMNQCREAGKTYVAAGKYGIVAYWYDNTKKWSPNVFAQGSHLDFMTNNLYTLIKEYKEETSYPEDKVVVGRDIMPEDIGEFCFTYEGDGTDMAVYQQYRYYVEDGKYLLFHERREKESGPLTEDDVVSKGIVELTKEQWDLFFSWIKGGTIEETQVSGDKYVITISWIGSDASAVPYAFPSFGASTAFQMKSYDLAHEGE